jgi:Flp pilus assembly protein TadD
MDDEALGPITDEARRAAAQEALARTNYAEQLTSDPFVVYMARFFRARLYDRLDLRAPAETAYRSALDVYPHAQSASMPLATLVFLRGEEAGAQALVDTVLANPGAEDPWRVYFLQDYRRLPVYIEQMRAALTSSR